MFLVEGILFCLFREASYVIGRVPDFSLGEKLTQFLLPSKSVYLLHGNLPQRPNQPNSLLTPDVWCGDADGSFYGRFWGSGSSVLYRFRDQQHIQIL